jgi:hypothetical protein
VQHPNKDLPALGIRQPWAELILQGIKTIEVRTLPTSVRGPIYLYTSKVIADTPAAGNAAARYGLEMESLPRGLLVGTVEIVGCEPCRAEDAERACLTSEIVAGKMGWRLARPQRLESPLKVRFLPYGVWFYPFKRKTQGGRREA